MLPDKPGDWPRVFEQHLNAGDLDAVMALYEPEGRFVTKSGETLIGRDQIRKVVGGLIEAKARLYSRVVKAVTVGDIAQLYSDFEGTMNDESGKSVAIRQQASSRACHSGTNGAVQEMPRLSGQAALRADWYNRSWSRPKAPCRLGPGNFYGNARPSRSAGRSTSPNKDVLPPTASHRNKLRPRLPHHHYQTERAPCLRDIHRQRWSPGPRSLHQWLAREPVPVPTSPVL